MAKIKEFFKPTKGKIILFIIIFIITAFIPIDENKYCSISMYKVYVETFFKDLGCNISGNGTFDWIGTVLLLIHLLIAYFITCLIIFYYNKSKNRKR